MRLATPDEAGLFVGHMARTFGARIVRRSDAIEMRLIAAALDAVRSVTGLPLPDFEDFLSGYATTLGPLVYLPDGLPPDELMTTVVHECQHVEQWRRGHLAFAWLYVSEPEARVVAEVEAYRAGLEWQFARTRQLPPLDALALPLEHGYALGPDQVAFGRRMLEGAATTTASGLCSTAAAIVAIAWARVHAPELLA